MTRARAAWIAFAVAAGLLAILALVRWVGTLLVPGPVLYGEGAVAHAAILARSGAHYLPVTPPDFVAANYTPLYFHLAGPCDPFMCGRLVSIASMLVVAAAIAWRARRAGALAAAALAAGWLALMPVVIWGPVVKPDPLALAFTVLGVLAARGATTPVGDRQAVLMGALFALAVLTKPTAAAPALLVGAYVLLTRPRAAALAMVAGLPLVGLAMLLSPGGPGEMLRHVVQHNALAWRADQALLLGLLALCVLAAPLAGAFAARRRPGPEVPYAVGGLAILAAGGRDGATINYLLDLSAAAALLCAAIAPELRRRSLPPLLGVAQLLAGAVLFTGTGMQTGAWQSPARASVAGALPPGPILAEDSGVLVASGRPPGVDDLFLWSRLVERGVVDRAPVLTALREGRYVRVVSEHDLERPETWPGYARQRWPQWLRGAVLERYVADSRVGGMFVYRPR